MSGKISTKVYKMGYHKRTAKQWRLEDKPAPTPMLCLICRQPGGTLRSYRTPEKTHYYHEICAINEWHLLETRALEAVQK